MAPAFASLARHFGEIGASRRLAIADCPGVRLGFGFMIVSIAGLLGAPVAGYLLGDGLVDPPWWKPNVFSGLAISIGAASFSTAWWIQRRRKGTSVV